MGACLKIARSGRAVAEAAIQLHGAIGMTEELSMGAYLKRLMAFESWPVTTAEHLKRCAAVRAQARGANEAPQQASATGRAIAN